MFTMSEHEEWQRNVRGTGGRTVRLHTAHVGGVSCTARTPKAARDALAAALVAWHGAGHDLPTVVTAGNVVGILSKRPLYYVGPADAERVEWTYVVAGSNCTTVMGGTYADALGSLVRHVADRAGVEADAVSVAQR